MARPRTYDPDEALDRSVQVFWERGFENTSIQDLVDATGVQRYGLYETFGDKRELFLKALVRYEQVWISGVLGDVEDQDASLPQLLAVFERLRVIAPPEVAPAGCLMCNSAAELGGHDAEVDRIMSDYMDRLHVAFERALTRARRRGEVAAEVDPGRHARFLLGVVLGISLHKRTPAGQAALDDFIDTALATIVPTRE